MINRNRVGNKEEDAPVNDDDQRWITHRDVVPGRYEASVDPRQRAVLCKPTSARNYLMGGDLTAGETPRGGMCTNKKGQPSGCPLKCICKTELLSYNLILECTLDVLVALYSCLVNTKLLSCLYSDVLLVNLYTSCNESLSELSCCN